MDGHVCWPAPAWSASLTSSRKASTATISVYFCYVLVPSTSTQRLQVHHQITQLHSSNFLPVQAPSIFVVSYTRTLKLPGSFSTASGVYQSECRVSLRIFISSSLKCAKWASIRMTDSDTSEVDKFPPWSTASSPTIDMKSYLDGEIIYDTDGPLCYGLPLHLGVQADRSNLLVVQSG